MQENSDPGIVKRRRVALVLALSFALDSVILDQVSKFFLFANSELINQQWLNGLISFVEHRNYGISFNIPLPLFITFFITLVVVGFAWKTFLSKPDPNRLMSIGLGLLTGGALGNLIDRLWLGFVRDWLLLGGRSAVNLADGLIIVGLLLLLTYGSKSAGGSENNLKDARG